MAASIEGYDLLIKLGYSIVPAGDDGYYRPGPKRWAMPEWETLHRMYDGKK